MLTSPVETPAPAEPPALAYHRRIAATSTSADRVERANRAIARLTKRTAAPAAPAPVKSAPSTPRPDTVTHRHHGEAVARQQALRDQVLACLADGQLHIYTALLAELEVSTVRLWPVIEALVASAQIVERPAPAGSPKHARSAYRLATDADRASRPPVRSVAVPAFDATALRQKVESVLRSGASYSLSEIVRNASLTQPHANSETVTEALEALMAAGKVTRIPIGTFSRYQGRALAEGASA